MKKKNEEPIRPVKLANNSITSDQQLEKAAKSIDGFVGVFPKNKVPVLKKGQSVIINLDGSYANGGTHWVGLRHSSEVPLYYYFDSFGRHPTTEISLPIYRQGKGLVASDIKYQKLNEENCGQWTLSFLRQMDRAAKDGRELEAFMAISKLSS